MYDYKRIYLIQMILTQDCLYFKNTDLHQIFLEHLAHEKIIKN